MDMQKAIELVKELESLNHPDGHFQYTFTVSKNSEKVPQLIMLYVSKNAGYKKELERFDVSHRMVHTIMHTVGLLMSMENDGSDPSDKENVEKLLAGLTKE